MISRFRASDDIKGCIPRGLPRKRNESTCFGGRSKLSGKYHLLMLDGDIRQSAIRREVLDCDFG